MKRISFTRKQYEESNSKNIQNFKKVMAFFEKESIIKDEDGKFMDSMFGNHKKLFKKAFGKREFTYPSWTHLDCWAFELKEGVALIVMTGRRGTIYELANPAKKVFRQDDIIEMLKEIRYEIYKNGGK